MVAFPFPRVNSFFVFTSPLFFFAQPSATLLPPFLRRCFEMPPQPGVGKLLFRDLRPRPSRTLSPSAPDNDTIEEVLLHQDVLRAGFFLLFPLSDRTTLFFFLSLSLISCSFSSLSLPVLLFPRVDFGIFRKAPTLRPPFGLFHFLSQRSRP